MRTIKYTRKFKQDFKREKNSGHFNKDLQKHFLDVVKLLTADLPLPAQCCDHGLSGEWKDHRDCHIKPDLILIYRKVEKESLELVRLGSHSQLGL